MPLACAVWSSLLNRCVALAGEQDEGTRKPALLRRTGWPESEPLYVDLSGWCWLGPNLPFCWKSVLANCFSGSNCSIICLMDGALWGLGFPGLVNEQLKAQQACSLLPAWVCSSQVDASLWPQLWNVVCPEYCQIVRVAMCVYVCSHVYVGSCALTLVCACVCTLGQKPEVSVGIFLLWQDLSEPRVHPLS